MERKRFVKNFILLVLRQSGLFVRQLHTAPGAVRVCVGRERSGGYFALLSGQRCEITLWYRGEEEN